MMGQTEITILPARTRGLGLLKGKIMGCFLRYALLSTANSNQPASVLTRAKKLIFIFVYLSIANWQVLVSKYKCTSSNELLAMQLISAGGGISSLLSKKWFCLLDLADICAICASPKGPRGIHLRNS